MAGIPNILGLSTDIADPNAYTLNPNANRLTDEAYQRAIDSTPQGEVDKITGNIAPQQNPDVAAKNVINRSQAGLGMMQDDALSSAIANRAKKSYESDLNRLQNQTALKGPSLVSQRLGLAADPLLKKQQYEYNQYAMNIKKAQSEEAARNATIGSVLGVVATIALA